VKIAKAIIAVQVALVAVIAFLIVRALMVFITPESAWTPLEQSSGLPPSSNPQSGQYANSSPIDTGFDPFHRLEVTPTAAPINIGEDAPETSLDLTLMGRRAGEGGSAILRIPDGSQKVFRIGDEILSGVKLEAVNVEYIVISQDGRLERLTFEKKQVSGLRAAQTSPAVPPLSPVPQQNTYSSNSLLASINFTPERANNQIAGYRISPKQAGFDTSLLGLEDGDVITSIGRIALQDEDIDLGAVLGRLQSRRSTTVELIRNGQPISVKVGTP